MFLSVQNMNSENIFKCIISFEMLKNTNSGYIIFYDIFFFRKYFLYMYVV